MAHDEFIQSLLIALVSNKKRGSGSPPVVARCQEIGEDIVLMTMLLRALAFFSKQYQPAGYIHLYQTHLQVSSVFGGVNGRVSLI